MKRVIGIVVPILNACKKENFEFIFMKLEHWREINVAILIAKGNIYRINNSKLYNVFLVNIIGLCVINDFR